MLKERGVVVTKDKTRYFPEWVSCGRQQGKCALTGEIIITDVENGDKVHIDHIIPTQGSKTRWRISTYPCWS